MKYILEECKNYGSLIPYEYQKYWEVHSLNFLTLKPASFDS